MKAAKMFGYRTNNPGRSAYPTVWGLSSDSLFHNKKWMFLISAATSPLTTSSALKTAGTFPETINTNSQWGTWWFISEEMHATQQTHPSLMSHGTTITFLSIEKLNGGGCVRACVQGDEVGEVWWTGGACCVGERFTSVLFSRPVCNCGHNPTADVICSVRSGAMIQQNILPTTQQGSFLSFSHCLGLATVSATGKGHRHTHTKQWS